MGRKRINVGPCRVDGCERPSYVRRLCQSHYARFLVHNDPLGGGHFHQSAEFIRDVALKCDPGACLTWPFARSDDGYGKLTVGNRTTTAHRYICEIVHGSPPSRTHQAAHSCGNGRSGCVNFHHLSWKTPTENAADRRIHGTNNPGEKSHFSKLTEAEVIQILGYGSEVSHAEISRKFRVTSNLVSLIRRRKVWKHIDVETTTPRRPLYATWLAGKSTGEGT